MIIVGSTRGLFRVTEIFFPQIHELEGVGGKLGLNQVIYIRQCPYPATSLPYGSRYLRFETSVIDLTRNLDSLFAEMSSTTRRTLRKTERVREQIEVRRNDSAAHRDFFTVYNGFVGAKNHTERLSASRLEALKPVSDVFVLYFDDRPVSAHLVLRDTSIRRVSTLLLASTRLNGDCPPNLVGSFNRWLHWYEMGLYKSEGFRVYDFCGIGHDTPEMARIADFKLSFGGTPVTEHNYILARLPGRAAISLFYMMRVIRAARNASRPKTGIRPGR